MKCFRHPGNEAVGICKYCGKGMCTECSRDTGVGVVCTPQCEEEVRALKAFMDGNKRVLQLTPQTHLRNSIFFALSGLAFIFFSTLHQEDPFLFLLMVVSGVIMLVGAAFFFINSRKYRAAANLSDPATK
jgi:hypothetical protein